VGFDRVEQEGNTITMDSGMALTLGGIAKGYIADKIKDLLIRKGIKSAVIDLGGNVVMIGNKPDGSDFRIGLRDPLGSSSDFFAIYESADKSLVSSGAYERFFTHNGVVYHHIMDVKTGFPIENELLQVTVISDLSVEGDGFSTTAFAFGLDRGLSLINSVEGIEAVFVTKDLKVYVTDGLNKGFAITSKTYELSKYALKSDPDLPGASVSTNVDANTNIDANTGKSSDMNTEEYSYASHNQAGSDGEDCR
jgi:thiamine biosynthesis lipoprotein